MASLPSLPRTLHAPGQLRPVSPRLGRYACRLVLLGAPFLVLCVLASIQIVTDAYPRTDATLTALANVSVPVTSVAATVRWNTCVRHRLQHRLAWFGPMNEAFVDQAMARCLTDMAHPDPELVRQMPALRERVARLWQEPVSMVGRTF